MNKLKKNYDIILGVSLLALFVVFTIIVKFVVVETIGPLGSKVGLANLNKWVHNLFGVNMTMYNITDWLGLVALAIILTFAIIGLVQWIKRKSLLKVDNQILALGIFYILVACAYLFFEFVVINRRPVLIEGILEASYPSSTTMLAITVCLSAITPINKLVKNKQLKLVLNICLVIFTIFMVVGRLVSGVHWFTDILAGIILSASLLFVYKFVLRVLNNVNLKNQSNINE